MNLLNCTRLSFFSKLCLENCVLVVFKNPFLNILYNDQVGITLL